MVTYDDTAGDVSMDDFSIARDMYEGGTVPLVRRAIAAGFGPEGTLQAYLDYPPDWMLKGALPDDATVDRSTTTRSRSTLRGTPRRCARRSAAT